MLVLSPRHIRSITTDRRPLDLFDEESFSLKVDMGVTPCSAGDVTEIITQMLEDTALVPSVQL